MKQHTSPLHAPAILSNSITEAQHRGVSLQTYDCISRETRSVADSRQIHRCNVQVRKRRVKVGQGAEALVAAALTIAMATNTRNHHFATVGPQHAPYDRIVNAPAHYSGPIAATAPHHALRSATVWRLAVVVVTGQTMPPVSVKPHKNYDNISRSSGGDRGLPLRVERYTKF
jgi:hypothetical protein